MNPDLAIRVAEKRFGKDNITVFQAKIPRNEFDKGTEIPHFGGPAQSSETLISSSVSPENLRERFSKAKKESAKVKYGESLPENYSEEEGTESGMKIFNDDSKSAHPVIKAVHSLTGRSAIFDPTQGATDSISQASRLNPEFTDFEWIWVPDNPTSNTLGGNSVFNMGSLGGSSSLNMGGIEEPQIGSGILTAGAMGLLNPGETLGVEDFVPDKVATEEK
jgi:hypothetical protein